jgi:6-phosphogluconolactonase
MYIAEIHKLCNQLLKTKISITPRMKTLRLIMVLTLLACLHIKGSAQKEILYAGTMPQRESKGLYVYEFDRKSDSFKLLQTKPEIKNPNFLVIHPNGKFLYSVCTVTGEDGKNFEAVSSFTINKNDGTLSLINQKPSFGKGACHINIDNKGKWIFVCHYNSGNMAVLPVEKDGGVGDTIQFIQDRGSSVSPRQKGPFVHSSLVSPDNKFVYMADLGTDKVMIYSMDQKTGKITPASKPWASTQPGAGPRHFVFHPTKSVFYLAQELNSTVSVFNRNKSTGALNPVQTLSTLPEGFSGRNAVADIHIGPDGKYLYVSNRGHNSLAIYSIKEDGKIELTGHEPVQGDHPRNFLIDPDGEFLLVANMNTDNITMFKIDKSTGGLKYSGVTVNVPAVVCLKWYKP